MVMETERNCGSSIKEEGEIGIWKEKKRWDREINILE